MYLRGSIHHSTADVIIDETVAAVLGTVVFGPGRISRVITHGLASIGVTVLCQVDAGDL